MDAPNGRAQLLLLLITSTIGMAEMNAVAAERGKSEWVYAGPNGKLVYKTTPAGDRIMDFSHAGYMGGGVALPAVQQAYLGMQMGAKPQRETGHG